MTDDYVQVGTWLLPEYYGPDYDHFTETHSPTIPGQCIAVYAKLKDVDPALHDALQDVKEGRSTYYSDDKQFLNSLRNQR